MRGYLRLIYEVKESSTEMQSLLERLWKIEEITMVRFFERCNTGEGQTPVLSTL